MKYIYKYLIMVSILIISILLYVSRESSYFGYKFFIVSSDSMSGRLNKGDLLIDQAANEFSIGDIVTFRSPVDQNNYITHRIVKENFTEELIFNTRGDNNSTEDPWQVTPDMITGKLKWSVPFIGYPILFLKSSVIYFFVLGGFLLLISFIEINLLSYEVANAWERKNSYKLYRNFMRFINRADRFLGKFKQDKIENAPAE